MCIDETTLFSNRDHFSISLKKGGGSRVFEHHSHFQYEFFYILSGHITFEIAGKHFTACEGTIFFLNMAEDHCVYHVSPECTRYVCLISESLLADAVKNPRLHSIFINKNMHIIPAYTFGSHRKSAVTLFFSELLREFEKQDDLWDTQAAVLLNGILLLLYRENKDLFTSCDSDRKRCVLLLYNYIAENLAGDLCLDVLSRVCSLSKYHMTRLFKEVTGSGLKEYIISVRVSEAKNLLCCTDLPITGICERVGFMDVNHFIRTFKKHTATTPFRYRKRLNSL
ncbi:transcriptional regulator with cupin sensor, AraC family [Treponema brennaborense DSM 12168]|uniref:Transcriptional regulator with cupin sensor, AraC family n=2 Tax=Treponema TaxID=157 RepID=F4LPC1_TREBD|nr:AraC family transcriptional regulator [Treponema brennaborense]AEE16983.1 transcriptional regulator with cupin sensor, AraC family [Treponema brennaborense DSM 12168]